MIFCPVLLVLFTHCNILKILCTYLLCSKIYVLHKKVFKLNQKREALSLQNCLLLSNAVSRKYSSSSVVSHMPLEIIWTICFPLLRKFFSSISPPTKARVERCWQERIYAFVLYWQVEHNDGLAFIVETLVFLTAVQDTVVKKKPKYKILRLRLISNVVSNFNKSLKTYFKKSLKIFQT